MPFKYLQNVTRYPKSERYMISSDSSRVQPNKSGELWSTNQKVICAHVDPPNWTFFGRLLRPLGDAGPLKFCTRARHWPRLANTRHKPGRGSLQKFKGEHLKLGFKLHMCAPITLGVVGVTSRNLTRGCSS